MSLFGKDREGKNRTHDAIPSTVSERVVVPREGQMFEREKHTNAIGGMQGTDAFLGKGTKITGKLVFEGTGRIEGRVDGEITAQDTLTIGDGATVNANITGSLVIIEGHVTGDVTARQRLELRASGRIQGNVSTPSLVVQEGAILNGQCSMSGAEARTLGEAEPTHILDDARHAALEVASTLSR